MRDIDDQPNAGEPFDSRGVAARAVRGSAYGAGAAVITLTLGFTRSILMARLLPPADFGLYALAVFFNMLVAQLRALGLDNGVVHRRELDEALLTTFLTMRLVLVAATTVLLLAAAPIIGRFYPELPLLSALIIAYSGVVAVHAFNATQEILVTRTLAFDRVAIMSVAASLCCTITSPLLAWMGCGVWSLLGEHIAGEVVRGYYLWGPYRVWRPRLGWHRPTAVWLWRFGARVWLANNISFAIENIDNFWVGTVRGATSLGYYSRAYDLAGYSRRVIGNPLMPVVFPTLARLQGDRLRLSQAFARLNMLTVRAALALCLIVILSAPEAIVLLLGARWVPMVPVFQLLMVYTGLDALNRNGRDLIMAVGAPERIVRIRAVQLAVLIPGLIAFTAAFDITGAALAVDLMMVVGAALYLGACRQYVDFSLRRLWLWPLVACVPAAAAVLALAPTWSGWPPLAVVPAKVIVAAAVYGAVLAAAERDLLMQALRMVARLWRE